MAEMYEVYDDTFTIEDEENKVLTPVLVSDFAEVTLKTEEGVEIHVNGELKGTASWTGRLSFGSYVFETRRQGHVPYRTEYDISANDNSKTIQIEAPEPIYGTLAIASTPVGAEISIDGRPVGETPKYISRQIIGKYTVTTELQGYEKQTKTIEVTEGMESSLSFNLKKQDTAVAVAPAAGSDISSISASVTGDFVLKVKGVEYPMVFVEGGTFDMGAYGEDNHVHTVRLSSYSIGKFEVTQELWEAVMGSNPSSFEGLRRPVDNVSWDDCQEFIRRLNSLTGKNFKLPTEAQWEYAARGGKKSRGYKFSGSNVRSKVAWCFGFKTHDVGEKKPNELGIYDMSGNVWEWCSDWYGSYDISMQLDPCGSVSGSSYVIRGGSWLTTGLCCRVSFRYSASSDCRGGDLGFRLCL